MVTCASYEARGFGVHAGMPLRAAARRCPDAVFLPSDPAAYDAASTEVMNLLRDLGHPIEGRLPVDTLWGIGPKTAKKLAALDITTVRMLAHADAETLIATFGQRTGLWILLLAKGGGDTEVSAAPWVPRSRSHVVTFPADLVDLNEMRSAIRDLAQRTLAEVVEQGRVVTHVAVTVRTAGFYTRTKVRKLTAPTVVAVTVVDAALGVFGLFDIDRPIRLLGVRLDLLMPG